jgi:hypothetical protein
MEPPKICGWNMMEPLFEGAVPVLFGYCYTGTYGPYPRIMGSRKNPIVTPSFSPQLQGQFPAYTSLIHTYPYPLLVYTQYISVLYIAINIINPSNYVNNYVPIYLIYIYISLLSHNLLIFHGKLPPMAKNSSVRRGFSKAPAGPPSAALA